MNHENETEKDEKYLQLERYRHIFKCQRRKCLLVYVDEENVVNIIEEYLDELESCDDKNVRKDDEVIYEIYKVEFMDTHQYTRLLRQSQSHQRSISLA